MSIRETAMALARQYPAVEIGQQQFYEDMIDGGWFVLTPDGIESTPAYDAYDDGSPAT